MILSFRRSIIAENNFDWGPVVISVSISADCLSDQLSNHLAIQDTKLRSRSLIVPIIVRNSPSILTSSPVPTILPVHINVTISSTERSTETNEPVFI